MEDSLGKAPPNLKENSKARLGNPHKSLESGDVGLKYQFKMLELMCSLKQNSSVTKMRGLDKSK